MSEEPRSFGQKATASSRARRPRNSPEKGHHRERLTVGVRFLLSQGHRQLFQTEQSYVRIVRDDTRTPLTAQTVMFGYTRGI